jgi:hypothetical protein
MEIADEEPVDEDIGMGMGMDTNMSGAKPQPFPLIGVSDILSIRKGLICAFNHPQYVLW